MKRKIYCKNCKWYQKYYSELYCTTTGCFVLQQGNPFFYKKNLDFEGNIIYIPKNSRLRNKIIDEYNIKNVKDATKLNQNFNCPFYKRKWWKFWVKPKRGPKNLLIELLKEK